MRGLIVKAPHIDRILSGKKTWEIRGHATRVRGRIMLIRGGSGQVVGSCEVVDAIGPLSLADLRRNAVKAGVKGGDFSTRPYKRTFAWVLRNVKRLSRSRPYKHPMGAQVWVRLNGARGKSRR